MNRLRFLGVMLMLTTVSVTTVAQTRSDKIKPRWLRESPKSINPTYRFSSVVSSGSNLEELRIKSISDLAADLGLEKGVTAVSSYKSSEYEKSSARSTKAYSIENSEFEFHSTINGKAVSFMAKAVDEYWEKTFSGDYLMTRLYVHSTSDGKAPFDSFRLTEKYYDEPATWALSLIPGAAQMHKGSYLKGGIIMGGSVVLAGGLVAFDSMRRSYLAKIDQTHSADVKKEYNNRAGNCATARNICIGGLAALYVYNIIDALIAPGARRVLVYPVSDMDGQIGVGANYKF